MKKPTTEETTVTRRNSAFQQRGLRASIRDLIDEIQCLYLEDKVPWVVGYSGGKDSTAVLQLVWRALAELSPDKRVKPIHVISTDTLVENPIVAAWVANSLRRMATAAQNLEVPITPHRLTPDVKDTFWVNLIGKGYPSPRNRFRWCTDRLKILPSNRFILEVVRTNGEAILVLGTRKAESSARAAVMTDLERHRIRARLSPNARLPNCLVYSPIEAWSNDDVWTFLVQEPNPWGNNNKDLLGMYQGASEDGECPLVIDDSTPSCGDSRFGCWVCTMVEEDKSMTAMIRNDYEKEWMLPLLELRNDLDVRGEEEAHLRDFRRIGGNVDVRPSRDSQQASRVLHVRGPYTQEARETWLRRVLSAQIQVRRAAPEEVRDLQLITVSEMDEIRRIWVSDKHEIEDRLPTIYEEVTGEPFPGRTAIPPAPFGPSSMATLRTICGQDRLQYEMVRELIDTEQRYRSMARRSGLFDALEAAIKRSFYDSEDDAISFALKGRHSLDVLRHDYGLSEVQASDDGQLLLDIEAATAASPAQS